MKEIANFYYFNYKDKIGTYESFRNFCLNNMIYFSLAISTPEVHVNADPVIYKISNAKTSEIKMFINYNKASLVEITEPKPTDKTQYFKIIYVDGTEKCFEYNEDIHSIFNNIEKHKVEEKCNVLLTPYLIFEDKEYSDKVKIMKEISQLIKNKQFALISQYLHENCIFEDFTNSRQKISTKTLIEKEYKKRAGLFNINLSKYSFYPTLEGKLTTENESIIELKVELTDKKYNRTNYILNIDFNENNKITYIRLNQFDKNDLRKTIHGDSLEKVIAANYNDYKTL